MKKALIAGAASVALAAMPVVGVFADTTSVKDQLTVNVNSSCTYDGITPEAATSETGNAYSVTGNAGTLLSFAATTSATSLTVKCNAVNGYTITPTFTSLKINGISGAANADQDIPYGTAINNATQAQRAWTAYYAKNGAETPVAFTASGTAISGVSTMTDTYTFSYKVGTGADQAAGTYVGTATYVLAPVAGS